MVVEAARDDGRVRVRWESKKGSGAAAEVHAHHRWVVPASLAKIGLRRSPRLADPPPSRRGIFGVELPELAAHERERKKKMKPPPVGSRGPNQAVRISKETKVTISTSTRLKEFPDDSLRISGGTLFCAACKMSGVN
eukprot:scaffold56399_cov26-Tisochrysis_lutea.AAC.1